MMTYCKWSTNSEVKVILRTICLCLMCVMTTPLSSTTNPTQHQQIVALITGANKGIGYEIVKRLAASETTVQCILGCRNIELGKEAISKLQKENDIKFDLLKIDLEDDPEEHQKTAKEIESKYGRCDVLINNAAVCFNDPTLYGKVSHIPFEQQAEITIRTNFFGTLSLTRAMIPLLEKSSSPRIINVASSAGRLSIIPSEERRKKFSSEQLTLNELEEYMKEFVRDVQSGTHSQRGWPNTGYGVSKVGIIAMTKVLARQHSNFMVNSVDPGYCSTDQNNNQGYVPAERGALTPFLLATLSTNENQFVTGQHFYEERAISWMYQ